MPQTSTPSVTPSLTPSGLRDITLPDSSTSPALAAVSAAAALRRLRKKVDEAEACRFWELSEAILQDYLATAATDHHLDRIRTPEAFDTVCWAVWEDYRFHFRHSPELIDAEAHPGAAKAALELVAFRIPSFVAAHLGADYASLSPFVDVKDTNDEWDS